MWFLPVAVAMPVENTVNIHQVVCHKIQGSHILIFMGFAMPVHFGQINAKRKITQGQAYRPQ
jgi:hydrogenase maturation factor